MVAESPPFDISSQPINNSSALTSIHKTSLNFDPDAHGKRKARLQGNNFFLWLKLVLSTTAQVAGVAIMSPMTWLTDPISTGYTLFVYPVLFAVLLVVQIGFFLMKLVGLDRIVNRWCKTYNAGLGPANWGNANNLSYQVSKPIMNRMRRVLSESSQDALYRFSPAVLELDPNNPSQVVRYLDLDVAQGLLLMSSIVYERNDEAIRKASDIGTGQQGGQQRADDQSRLDARRDAQRTQLIEDSERTIRNKAYEWDMKFQCVTEMKTAGGPYAGLFYPTNGEPWMVLAFKGTTPNNYAEWLVDSNFSKTNANVYLDGNVHEGFYDSIFPDMDDPESPYSRMIDGIRTLAASMRSGSGQKINLWVTGHSLGSALAGLMYARLLKSTADLGDDVCLRHAYLYGTPRLGDVEFCSKVASNTITPITRDQIIWRIADNSDIVTRVPPGLADASNMSSSLPGGSLLNYGHVGAGVHLLSQRPPLYIFKSKKNFEIDSTFFIGANVKIVAASRPTSGPVPTKLQGMSPIKFILGVMPSLLRDHFPYQYFERLENLLPNALVYGPEYVHNAST